MLVYQRVSHVSWIFCANEYLCLYTYVVFVWWILVDSLGLNVTMIP